jgi:hypothetical protein
MADISMPDTSPRLSAVPREHPNKSQGKITDAARSFYVVVTTVTIYPVPRPSMTSHPNKHGSKQDLK